MRWMPKKESPSHLDWDPEISTEKEGKVFSTWWKTQNCLTGGMCQKSVLWNPKRSIHRDVRNTGSSEVLKETSDCWVLLEPGVGEAVLWGVYFLVPPGKNGSGVASQDKGWAAVSQDTQFCESPNVHCVDLRRESRKQWPGMGNRWMWLQGIPLVRCQALEKVLEAQRKLCSAGFYWRKTTWGAEQWREERPERAGPVSNPEVKKKGPFHPHLSFQCPLLSRFSITPLGKREMFMRPCSNIVEQARNLELRHKKFISSMF